jgi:hypothetical protein
MAQVLFALKQKEMIARRETWNRMPYFESGNDLPAMPPPGPERERLLDPDLPLDEMTEEMRTVCVQLDELKEKMRLGKNVYLRGEDFMAVIVCVRSVSSRKRSTTRTPGPCNEIFAPELQVHRKAARACTRIFGITACRPCDKLVRKRSTKKLPEGQVHAKYRKHNQVLTKKEIKLRPHSPYPNEKRITNELSPKKPSNTKQQTKPKTRKHCTSERQTPSLEKS